MKVIEKNKLFGLKWTGGLRNVLIRKASLVDGITVTIQNVKQDTEGQFKWVDWAGNL